MKEGKGRAKWMAGATTGPKYCYPQRSCIERGKMYLGYGVDARKGWNNIGSKKTESACQV